MARSTASDTPVRRSIRSLVPGLLATSIAVVVAGCGLLSPPVAPHPSRLSRTPEPIVVPSDPLDAVPTLPAASSGGPDFADAANALADLDSYRVDVTTTGLVPAFAPGGTVTMTSTLIQGDHSAASFVMSGVDGFALGRLEGVVIDDEAWLKEGDAGWRKSPGGAADFDAAYNAVSPIDLAAGFDGLSPSLKVIGAEKHNGVATQHTRVVATDDGAATAGLSAGSADLWIAVNGGELVGLDLAGTWNVDGTDTPVTLRIEVTRIDSRSNVVKPPA